MRFSVTSLSAASLLLLGGLVGGDASAATGGPDAFGYTFVDQDDGAVFQYVDITATGAVIVSQDDGIEDFVLNAPFTFYGADFTNLAASTNGFVTLAGETASDIGNSCPLPDGGSLTPRIEVIHDDLVTTVQYQYFDAVEAAVVGYPGQTGGISVIQWTGTHFGSGEPVDSEAILFHDSGEILVMVAADGEAGISSTTGIFTPTTPAALTYVCDTGGSIGAGVTAVLYTPPGPPMPDSDCCTESATDTPGCLDDACEASVCAANPGCCTTDWDASCAAEAMTTCPLLCGGMAPAVTINEIRIDQSGGDDDEFFELSGPPGVSLDGLDYIVIGDVTGTGSGGIEAVITLDGLIMPPTGLFVVAEGSFTLGVANHTTNLSFENSDTVTHMLVAGFSGNVGDDVDVDDDGVLDSEPWSEVLDRVAVIEDGSELSYASALVCAAGPTCQEVPDTGSGPAPAVFRCPNGTGTWGPGGIDEGSTDSAGLPNPCACGDGVIAPGEECDDTGESATCDLDCTAAACGDSTLNITAGEECDDGGESAICDTDCTAAVCGDTTVNATAGEDCDDGGESATCDVDCTDAACGDNTLNTTAGEECDTGGESATCDSDCTLPACGDGVVNMAAGEECDDGGVSPDCDADCTFAVCGDGVINADAGEECDDGGESATCDADCTAVACGDGVANTTAGEDCDDGGESATCDDDCTAAECGDLVVNMTAGENCDDGGRSETCNADCTAATCGDGLVNMTAGEQCDGDGAGTPGETETCDDDCSEAMCGDGVTNETAGEDCDGAGESADCNDDCTAAMCGDGVLNETAGEECDDGNTDDDDGCASDCTEEMGGSTGDGDSGDSGSDDGMADTTAGMDSTGDGGSGSGGQVTTSGPSTVSASGDTTDDGSSGTGGGSNQTGGTPVDDDGCSCTSGQDTPRGMVWSLFGLLGLTGLRRRRRRS